MNALVEQRTATPHASGQNRGATVRRALEAAETMVTPWAIAAGMNARFPRWTTETPWNSSGRPPVDVETLRRGDGRGTEALAAARHVLANLPTLGELHAVKDIAETLASALPEPSKTRLLIGVMVDRYPNLKAHEPTTYTEGLIFEAEGYPAAVVAKATLETARTCKFLPSPAEFAEALVRASNLGVSERYLGRAIEARTQIEAALEEAERLGPIDLTDQWRQWMRAYCAEGRWNAYQSGPPPGTKGCLVPPPILAEFGYGPEGQKLPE